MTISFKPLAAAALIALAGPTWAQDTTEGQGGAAPGGDLELGVVVSDDPEIGQAYIREEIGDWSLRCVRVPEGQEEPCQLYKLLTDEAGNSVAEISFFRLPEGAPAEAGATIVTPLETLLTAQLTLAVDAEPARRYPFAFCTQVGCISRVGFTSEELDSFRRGSEAVITIVPAAAPDQQVILRMSLNGFTAGLEQASVAQN